ncbi:MAG: glycoside hydrolase [Dehalococcoidia bacterium]|nr:glycoside hydrolase [Dehalococcoidia bacterium]
MAQHLTIYALCHQPRRIKLPAEGIKAGASPAAIESGLFDEDANRFYFREVATYCYHPAMQLWRRLLDEGMALGLGVSVSFLKQAESWDESLLDRLRQLAVHPQCELVAVEPYHSFLPLIDLPHFQQRMRWGDAYAEALLGRRPRVADTTEMLMSDAIYTALAAAGYEAAFLDGREWVLGWRQPTRLYHGGLAEGPHQLQLLARHRDLSDDVGYRFSNREWDQFPLLAPAWAKWVAQAGGDFVCVSWDFETFGAHHTRDSGIFEFLAALPRALSEHNVQCLRPSEIVGRFQSQSHCLPLPHFATTWAGDGNWEFFLGNKAQQALFQLMLAAYNKARLTDDDQLIDLALWLLQSDNLHWLQWYGHWGPEAEVSAYFTPREWWSLGTERIVWEQQLVYLNFLSALDPYIPSSRSDQPT